MATPEPLLDAVAGGLSGTAVDFVLFPLDTIKTRLQARRSGIVAPQKRNFYQGLFSAMMASFPAAATFWTTYQGAKRVFVPASSATAAHASGDDHASAAPPTALRLAAGHIASATVAEVVVTSLRNPFEVVKQQMQVGLHPSTRAAVRTIWAAEGVRGFYAGYGSTIARELPFDAIQFSLYEWLKRQWRERKGGADLVLWENAVLGSIAGGCAAALTTPLDVVKTRLMTQAGVAEGHRYAGVVDALTRIAREEGMVSLFAGIRPRVAWISLGGAIFIGSFEEISRRLHRSVGGRDERREEGGRHEGDSGASR